jgi:hypothetical protein
MFLYHKPWYCMLDVFNGYYYFEVWITINNCRSLNSLSTMITYVRLLQRIYNSLHHKKCTCLNLFKSYNKSYSWFIWFKSLNSSLFIILFLFKFHHKVNALKITIISFFHRMEKKTVVCFLIRSESLRWATLAALLLRLHLSTSNYIHIYMYE